MSGNKRSASPLLQGLPHYNREISRVPDRQTMMQPLNIQLPESIANALSAYMSDQQTPAEAIVEAALLEFFTQHGYLPPPTDPVDPLPSAAESFRQGWHDAMTGNTIPIAQLWDGIDVE
jgi:hypothetical protein